MSITVPTAQQRSGATPPRPPGGHGSVRGLVALIATVAVTMLAWGGRESPSSPTMTDAGEPVLSAGESPTADESAAAELTRSAAEIEWEDTYFPGTGAVTGAATSIHGMAVVGQRRFPGGEAFVWTRAPGSDQWVGGTLEGGANAVVRDVEAYVDGFVVAGAIVEPGSGTSVPTLWFGTAGSAFTVRDRPFAGPGRIDQVHVIAGRLVLVGQAAGPFSDHLQPGAARFGRLLSGSPGTWTDLTPSGASVVVSDVVEFADGLLAVGADSGGPLAWWRSEITEEWSATRIASDERAVAVDVVSHPDGGFAALVRTWADRDTPVSTVFRAEHPEVWDQTGLPLRRALGWIEPSDSGVVAGAYDSVGPTADSPVLWHLGPLAHWSYERVVSDRGTLARTELRGARGDTVFGSVASQPVVWHPRGTNDGGMVVSPESSNEWRRAGPLPAESLDVIDTGRHLIAFARPPDAGGLWISADGQEFRRVNVHADFDLGGVGETDAGAMLWGQIGSAGVIYDVGAEDGSVLATRTLPATSVRHVSESRYGRRILAETPSGPARIVFGDRGDQTVTAVPALPPRIVDHAGVLIGFDHVRPIGSLMFSPDRGDSWRRLKVSGFSLATSQGALVVVSGDRRMWAVQLDTFEVHEVDVPDRVTFDSTPALGAFLPGWVGGFIVDGPAHLAFGADLAPILTNVSTAVESGMLGVFVGAVPGPRGYAVVAEGGQSVLYRWNGAA